jgi:AcrR family transcriptional regulator
MLRGMERAGPVSRRNRPAKAALSQDTIVDAAMELLTAEGLDGVSMRRVAQTLDTGPASLYVYVQNRDELIALLMDRIAGDITLPPDDGTGWRERLIGLMLAAIRELSRYPGIAVRMFATIPTGPNALALTDALLGLLAQAGLDRQTRAWAVDVLALYIVANGTEATLHVELGTPHLSQGPGPTQPRNPFAGLPPERYPNLTDLREEFTYGSSEQRTRWSIDVLINGILATDSGVQP